MGIPFFADHNVPESVCLYLESEGHQVTRLRTVMATETADTIIAAACSHSGHVLISHDNDFRSLAKRLEITQRTYMQKLHRIQLRCSPPNAATRVKEAMSMIENEWGLITPNRPMVIEIRYKSIHTLR